MATKNITGSYPSGYALDPAFQTLNISSAATVGGTGVTTTASQPSTINNLGKVQGTGNGITLSDGGAITNGSASNTTALIEGTTAIVANNASATIKNSALIKSDVVVSGYNSTMAISVALNHGGAVTNVATGQITNGVLIATTPGTVTNDGTVGGSMSTYSRNHAVADDNYSNRYSELNSSVGPSVTLDAGGVVKNGTAGNTSAVLTNGIQISMATGTVTNLGSIGGPNTELSSYSYSYQFSSGYKYTSSNTSSQTDFSVQLKAGGSVTNGTSTSTSAQILHGVQISGASGTVTNDGTVGAIQMVASNAGYAPDGYRFSAEGSDGPSVSLLNGGTVTNGTQGNGAAVITNGIVISGGVGKVTNNGKIGSSDYYSRYGSSYRFVGTYRHSANNNGYAITLSGGGSVTNGTTTNTTATINNGIFVSGGIGTIVNHGLIAGSPNTYFYYYGGGHIYSTTTTGYSISLQGGGSVTNGGTSDTAATITTGIDVTGGTGKIVNYGTIQNDATDKPTVGIKLEAGGTVVNGSASNATATISAETGIGLSGVGTVTNFGGITGTGGTAISFNSSSARLIEQGSGVLDGAVMGGGGTLELAAQGGVGTLSGLGSSITGFATVTVDKGASWSLSGASTIALNTVLSNSGMLDLAGLVTNSGEITNLKGATLAFDGDYSITTDPAVKAGQFSNAGILEKTAGTGTSIIRTGTASLTDTGTIDVETGMLELTGATIDISGAIKGAGTIEFGPGETTLGDGTSITTAGLTIAGAGAQVTVARDLGYAGAFSAEIGTELTIEAGDLLKLTGQASFFRDTVDGAGRLMTTGSTSVGVVTLGGTAQWYNAGLLTETSALTVGDSLGNKASFVNQATGVFDLVGNVGIGIGTAATSTFTNQGLLAKTAGGLSAIGIGVMNTGMLESANGTLDLQQAVTGNGGTLKIDTGKAIQADAAVSSGQTVDFNGGGDKLVLTDAAHFAAKLQDFGAGDKLDLREFDPAATTLAYVENAGHTAGTLTVTDGALQAKIALLGDYTATAFHAASDGVAGGTFIAYTPPASPMLAAPHS